MSARTHTCWDCDGSFPCGQQYSSCPENADPACPFEVTEDMSRCEPCATRMAEDYEASKISRYYDGVAE